MTKPFHLPLSVVRLLNSLLLVFLLSFIHPLLAQTITTVAGNNAYGDGGPATDANLKEPMGITADKMGNLYVVDWTSHRVRKIAPNGIITSFAGDGTLGSGQMYGAYGGDGGPATSAQLNFPFDVTADDAGNVYIADSYNSRIRKVAQDGTITTHALLNFSPRHIVADKAGHLFVSDYYGNSIKKVASDGTVSNVAGNGMQGGSGDGGLALNARLSRPAGLAVDAAGNLFIADAGNSRIRKVSLEGIITTIAGSGTYGFEGDGGPAISAHFRNPTDLALDAIGNLIIADADNHRIRKVSPEGIITTIAGNGQQGFGGDGEAALNAELKHPGFIAMNESGEIYFLDNGNKRLRKVTLDGIISTIAGNGTETFGGDGRLAINAMLRSPKGIRADDRGNLFIADYGNNRVRRVSTDGIINTVAGNGSGSAAGGLPPLPGMPVEQGSVDIGDGGGAINAKVSAPILVTTDAPGNLYIGEEGGRIRKVSPEGIITTVAGTGTHGYSGDGGPAISAQLSHLAGLVVDAAGNLFIADAGNNRVRKVSPEGVITTVAGDGNPGSGGDGGPAISAQLSPSSIAISPEGHLYISESYSGRIRKVLSDGTITTVAGNGDPWGDSGDNGPATSASIFPESIGFDGSGNLYIGERGYDRIRKVSLDGTISTIFSNSFPDPNSQEPQTSFEYALVTSIGVDGWGNVFFSDDYGNRVRKLEGVCTAPNITTQPVGITLCAGSGSQLSVAASGFSLTYQWQVNSGSGFTNLSDNSTYSGATTSTLSMVSAPIVMNGYSYRCVVTSGSCSSNSSEVTLTVNAIPPTPDIANTTVEQGAPAVSLTASNCSGTLVWTGPNGISGQGTIVVPTPTAGSYTYSVQCQVGECISPSATVKVTVTTTAPSGPLRVTPPLYDCTTRSLTIRTAGGNTNPIEYHIPSVTTGWVAQATFILENKHIGRELKLRARQRASDGKGFDEAEIKFVPTACGTSSRIGLPEEETVSELTLTVLGNPVADEVRFEIRGVEGQPVQLRLLDLKGRTLEARSLDAAAAVEQHSFDVLRQPSGILLLQIATPNQQKVVKVLKR